MRLTHREEIGAGELHIIYEVDLAREPDDSYAVTLWSAELWTHVDLLTPLEIRGCDLVQMQPANDDMRQEWDRAAEQWLSDHADELWRAARDSHRDEWEEARAEQRREAAT